MKKVYTEAAPSNSYAEAKQGRADGELIARLTIAKISYEAHELRADPAADAWTIGQMVDLHINGCAERGEIVSDVRVSFPTDFDR